MNVNDLTGQTFGKLTVLERAEGSGMSKWLCRCECGNEKVVFGTNLKNGRTQSCGCTKYTHRDSNSKLYGVYTQILRYDIVDEWKDYLTFKKWAVDNGYVEGVRICRKDVNKPYCPDNCEIKHKI